jgi:hypothetical protein
MKSSFLAFGLVLGLSVGLAVAAQADPMTSNSSQLSAQTAQMPTPSPGDAALRDYRANVNPATNIGTTGIYDEGDRYLGPRGTPLPGWGSANGEGAGDN